MLSCGANSSEFYVEATPAWNRPRRMFDLRDTTTSFYLKAITPIEVNPGYKPYLFIANVESEPFALKSDIVACIHRASSSSSSSSSSSAINKGLDIIILIHT